MAVKKRCGFCRKVLREDGTCQNKDCPRYEEKKEQKEEKSKS
jgi:hypothetical protein